MKKKILLVVSILAILVIAITAFVGCESFKNSKLDMDSADSASSNGGSVIVHGDYIYFINGYSGLLSKYKENWFGNVVKGAVMRIKKTETDLSKAEVVVPKAVYSTASNSGISIYGDYVYYVTSSSDENRDGTIDTSTLLFMRTRLDGQDTSVILEVANGLSTQYKYTPNGLLYVKDSNVYFKSTEGKIKTKDEGKVVASEISAVHFPVSTSYKKGENDIADYFFYTVTSSEIGDYTNTLYVCSPDGTSTKLIDKYTFTDTPDEDVKNAFSVSIVASKDLDGKLALIYRKDYYASTGSTTTANGMYMYVFDSTSFSFNKANERKIASESLSSLTIIDENTIIGASGVLTLYSYNPEKPIFDTKAFVTEHGKIESATVVGVNDGYLYLIVSSQFKRIKLDMSTNIETLGTNKVHTSFVAPELITVDGNTYIFYFNSSVSNYLYRLNLNSYNAATQEVDDELMGRKTQADIDAEEK